MNYYKFIFVFSLVIVCLSCTTPNVFEGEHKFIEHFPQTLFPVAEKLVVDMPGIVNLAIVDTVLLAVIMPDPEILLQSYSLNNYKQMGTLIKKGKGPDEFLQASMPIQFVEDATNCYAWMWDHSLRCFYLLNITKTIKYQRTIIEQRYDLKNLGFSSHLVYVNDTLFWGTNWTFDNLELFAYNVKKEEIIYQTKLFKPTRNPSNNISAFSHSVTVKPDLSKIVINMLYLNQLHVISLNNTNDRFSFSTSKNPGNIEQIIYTNADDDLILYYRDVRATDQFIFAIYNECTRKYEENPTKTIIHVFDWYGNPIAIIDLPYYSSYFAIDEKGGYLYGLSEDVLLEQEIFYKYDISKLLSN